jgi:hypothetical protein
VCSTDGIGLNNSTSYTYGCFCCLLAHAVTRRIGNYCTSLVNYDFRQRGISVVNARVCHFRQRGISAVGACLFMNTYISAFLVPLIIVLTVGMTVHLSSLVF